MLLKIHFTFSISCSVRGSSGFKESAELRGSFLLMSVLLVHNLELNRLSNYPVMTFCIMLKPSDKISNGTMEPFPINPDC